MKKQEVIDAIEYTAKNYNRWRKESKANGDINVAWAYTIVVIELREALRLIRKIK